MSLVLFVMNCDSFWTGIYSSRVREKELDRAAVAALTAAQAFHALALSANSSAIPTKVPATTTASSEQGISDATASEQGISDAASSEQGISDAASSEQGISDAASSEQGISDATAGLKAACDAIGISQHHDAIPGTSNSGQYNGSDPIHGGAHYFMSVNRSVCVLCFESTAVCECLML
jgi:hypothetical protein